MFKLEFDTNNAAFAPGPDWMGPEIVRILRNAADRIENGGIDFDDPRPVADVNGNEVGEFVLTRDSWPNPEESERAIRAAWNNFVFARAELPPGPGMALVPEADAFDKLSDAFHKLTAEWDAR